MLGAFANHGTGYGYISRKLQICYSLKAEMRLKRVPYLRVFTPPGLMLGGFFPGSLGAFANRGESKNHQIILEPRGWTARLLAKCLFHASGSRKRGRSFEAASLRLQWLS
jgi:hypothetical protein